MIEIVCPSCQARYRLPEGAIGENGRRVSCSACGHAWHAFPDSEEETLTLGPEAAAEPATGSATDPAPAAAPADQQGEPPRVEPLPGRGGTGDAYAAYESDERVSGTSPYSDEEDRGMAAYEAFAREQEEIEDAETADGAPQDRTDPEFRAAPPSGRQDELAEDRAQQMAQIRSMLDDIKQSPGATPAAEPEPGEEEEDEAPAPPPRPSAIERTLREVEEEERDPLRAKLDQYAKPGKPGDTRQSRNRMLKKHAKKVRRRKMEEKRGSGTFLTGFLLVVLVVSVMAAVYLLHPLIIAKVPDAEPAIRDYVATMDQFRLWLGEQAAAAQVWVQEIISGE